MRSLLIACFSFVICSQVNADPIAEGVFQEVDTTEEDALRLEIDDRLRMSLNLVLRYGNQVSDSIRFPHRLKVTRDGAGYLTKGYFTVTWDFIDADDIQCEC